jgi:hypothetical protein
VVTALLIGDEESDEPVKPPAAKTSVVPDAG